MLNKGRLALLLHPVATLSADAFFFLDPATYSALENSPPTLPEPASDDAGSREGDGEGLGGGTSLNVSLDIIGHNFHF